MISDEELYRRLLAGDQGALEALVHRYHSNLLGFLYRQSGGDRFLAEDLVQETFTKLVSYHGEPPQQFRSWAFTVAANLLRDHFRSAYQRREQPDAFEGERRGALAGTGPGADELLLRDDARREVVAALDELPAPKREVLVLKFFHELRIEEIAAVTGAPVGTVKSRLFHGLKQMKARLGGRKGGTDHEQSIRP